MPNPRWYVLVDGSALKQIAKVILNEIHLWWTKMNSINKIAETGPLERIVKWWDDELAEIWA